MLAVMITNVFPGITKLDDGLWKCDGAPNWRRVPGFPIYATGQPLKEDIEKCVEQAVKKYAKQLEQDRIVAKHLDTLYQTMLEQNLCRIIEPYSRVQVI